MEEVKAKNNLFIIILMLVAFLFSCVFATLCYYRYIYESEPIIITTTNLKLSVISDNLRDNESIMPTTWSNNMEENENNKNITKLDLKVSSTSRINATYKINMQSTIKQNELYEGGNIADIKCKIYKDGSVVNEGEFTDETDIQIADGTITTDEDLNDEYQVYVYIEETDEIQDSLKDISFDFKFIGEANQVEE